MRPKILIACEYSGIVRDAFIKLGHDAISCDLIPTENAGPHYQGNVLDIINNGWDLMIAHPPCTYLAYSGIGHWNKPGRLRKRLEALDFFAKLWEAPIERICIENPKGCASPTIAKYTQSIQPFYFGDSAYKTTWLWLKNLKPLEWKETDDLFGQATAVPPPVPVYVDKNGKARHFTDSFSNFDNRGHDRAKFWKGIATAMAEQWGAELGEPGFTCAQQPKDRHLSEVNMQS
jgi:hypothetical protein